MNTEVKQGGISNEIQVKDVPIDPFIEKFNEKLLRIKQEVENNKKHNIELLPTKYHAKVSQEGFNNIKSLIPKRSDNQIRHFVDYIEWRLNKCLTNGMSLLEYHDMSKAYKAIWFKGAKNDFSSLKNHVFIPYINLNSGKESYTKGKTSKSYRLNPFWIKKYITFESTECNSVRDEQPYLEMKSLDLSKCKQMDENLNYVKVVPDLINDKELLEFAKSHIDSYLTKVNTNKYTYSHSTKELIQVQFKPYEYPVFKKIESFIQSKYLKYRLTKFANDTTKAKRNEYEGRLYHRMTNFPKKLYKYLLFDNEKIGEIDMANCFPTLIVLAILGIYDPFNQFQNNLYLTAFETAIKDKENPIYKLVYHTTKGKFYDHIIQLIFPRLSEEMRSQKKNFIKSQISQILYGKYNSTNWIKEKLKRKIPLFIKIIDTQKQNYYSGFKSPKNKKYYDEFSKGGEKTPFKTGNDIISILGMRTESKLFLDTIFPELSGEYFLTKHDSILCPISKLNTIENKMTKILDNELGKRNYTLKTTQYL